MFLIEIFSTHWLNAGMVLNGAAQTFIGNQATQNRILHSVHVIRDKNGDDAMLMVFVKEDYARENGIHAASLPSSISLTPPTTL